MATKILIAINVVVFLLTATGGVRAAGRGGDLQSQLSLSGPAVTGGDWYRLVSSGVDTSLFAPAAKASTIVVELRPNEREVARGTIRALRELPGWEVVVLRTKPLIARPPIPRDAADPA